MKILLERGLPAKNDDAAESDTPQRLVRGQARLQQS